jgi:hypothetical protein
MGGGFYSEEERYSRATDAGYYTSSRDDIFTQNKQREIHSSMNPTQAHIREARDSDDHPESVPIIVGLDFTGSMGHIPHHLIKDGLPTLMGGIIQNGVPDAQLLFLGIGDHEVDDAPLQVGQFEASDELIDQWLTRSWLEGGGGGNDGESYLLAWYFAAKHTFTDSFEKRNKKGYLFTIGDEPSLRILPSRAINKVMGLNDQVSYGDRELLEMAQEKYHVYHIHMGPRDDWRGSWTYWNNLLGENCIQVSRDADVATIIKNKIVELENSEVGSTNVTSDDNSEEGAINFGF